MYVCLCQGVTDGQIRSAIQGGCCTYRDVRIALGVGTQCGKCACVAKQIARESLGEEMQNSQDASFCPAVLAAS
ncbi:bacterioferritin-associated ferredoxin [Azotobacter beijerinckii]|uniref:bacterioferritin-associated ferredoxin n=1 Tax=Azotobacter beijerinckii TaxID=170623 RepID=UPI0029558539|nr:bacterioferritin-associated ferredoxin [Azotobacter beijerinckii]MDV7213039.1 bacterioferritin-associated ferredoxin [Azotobacter beijerinckii]